jgi:hypothetical protein
LIPPQEQTEIVAAESETFAATFVSQLDLKFRFLDWEHLSKAKYPFSTSEVLEA